MDTDRAWELWAQQDPYYGVLTDSRFRSAVITPALKEEFLASGHGQICHVLEIFRRVFGANVTPRRALDFGCGVGRTLMPMAAISGHVVGVDVAPSMLAEARRNCADRNVANAALVLSDDTLSGITGTFDFIHSSMVFQHIESQRGRGLFGLLLDRLEPGGFGAIHLTFGLASHAASFGRPVPPPVPPPPGAAALARAALSRLRRRWTLALVPSLLAMPSPAMTPQSDPDMEMHWYQMSELLFMLQRAGVADVFNEFTDHGGAIGAFLYFRRSAA